LALVVVVALAPGVFWERLHTIWNGSNAPLDLTVSAAEQSKEERLDLLTRSIQYTLEHPVFGVGLGNFSNVSGTELNQPDAWLGTHNTFTEISSEAGVPALLLFIGVLVTAARNLVRVGNAPLKDPENLELPLMARAALASLLSFVFAGFFVHLAYTYYFFYTLAIAVGIHQIAHAMEATSAEASRDFCSTMQLSSVRSSL
jgi:O-antigen ligase